MSVHGTDEREPFGDKRYPDSGPSTSNPLQRTKLPASIQQSIWAKVQSYLEDESSYSKSPGVIDYTSVLVKSSSSERPHFVIKKSSSYKCDSDCLMFKSTNGLCSHSLLAASLNGVQCSQFQLLKIKATSKVLFMVSWQIATVNFSTPGPPPLLRWIEVFLRGPLSLNPTRINFKGEEKEKEPVKLQKRPQKRKIA